MDKYNLTILLLTNKLFKWGLLVSRFFSKALAWGNTMKILNLGLVIAGLAGSSSVHAFQASLTYRNAQKAQVDAMTPANVLTKLKQTGWGSCYVSVGVQGTTYCKNYFVSSKPPYTGTYRGYPAHQKADPNAPRYSSYSRIKPGTTPQDSTQQASTGCFSGAGGAWSGSVCWLGNDAATECNLSEADYAVAMLKSAIDDPEDPCSLYEAEQNSSSSSGITALLTGNKLRRDGLGNCYQQITNPSGGTAYYKVAESKSPECLYMKRRAKFELTNKVLPLLGTATVLNQTSYLAALTEETSARLAPIKGTLTSAESLSQYPLTAGRHTFQECLNLAQSPISACVVKGGSSPACMDTSASSLSTADLSGTYCSLSGQGAACPSGWTAAVADAKYGGNSPCGGTGACCY